MVYAKHLQLCILTQFQGVGRPINTTLEGPGDWATSHKMISGDRYTRVLSFCPRGTAFDCIRQTEKVEWLNSHVIIFHLKKKLHLLM